MPSNEAPVVSTHSNGSALDADPNSAANGAKRTHHIPQFQTKEEVRRWQLEQMAGAFRVFAKMGFADGASGHISLRDPVDTDTFWINPYGVHFGLLKVSDLDEQGRRVGGADAPVSTGGFLIHSAIHQARPDINVAVHTHTPYGRAWSVFGRGIEMLCQDSCMFLDDLAVYGDFGGVVFAAEEGRRIAEALGPVKKNIILRNHGILSGGGTVGEAVGFFIALERACQTQLLVERVAGSGSGSGLVRAYVGEEEARYTKRNIGNADVMYMQFEPEYRLILKETGGDFLE
ncbi:Meiotically up-regulated gene 14 protein [Cytospora mali]|uniref:Meiotically up-regulated gene 14 protein n=1 Tax=Cytospora mali TaxID=578113 RepID=A0A194UP69_CYTMA|nr:Meiotically up-regulated gene 14 protein [Valsa mali var. pyri (nom. inval.)]